MGTTIICADAVDKLLKPDVFHLQLPTIEQFGKIYENRNAINNSLRKINGASDIKNDFHWSRDLDLQESTPKPYLKIYYFGRGGQATEVSPSNTTYKGYWYIQVQDLN